MPYAPGSGLLNRISISPDRQWLRSYPDRGGCPSMRRASICLAALGVIALGLPATSSAAEPTASITKFKAKAIPIPKPGGGSWPKTGNILGAGAAAEAEYLIEGSSYGGTGVPPKVGSLPRRRRGGGSRIRHGGSGRGRDRQDPKRRNPADLGGRL